MGVKFPIFGQTFDSGMTTKNGDQTPGIALVTKHFDNYTDPGKLTPHRSMKLDAVAGNEASLDNYQIHKIINTPSGIYAHGVVSGSGHPQVYIKASSPTDPTQVWTTATNGSDGAGVGSTAFLLFMYYHGVIYGDNSSGLWSYTISGPTFNSSAYTTHQPSGQGIVHSKDDIMYFPSSNLIIANNAGSFSVGLTLPTGSNIADICEYNDYIAILTNQADGTVTVYIWDRNTGLSTLSSKIDFGMGTGVLIENLGGVLSVVMISTTSGSVSLVPKMHFKYWTGAEVKTFQEFTCDRQPTIANCKQVFNNLFYFLADVKVSGVVCKGVWKIVKRANGSLVVSFDRLPRNDTTLDDGASGLRAFRRIGDYMFISYTIPVTGLATVWRTDDSPNYTATSTFETPQINVIPGLRNRHIPDSSIVKKLIGVTLNTEPLTSGQSAGVNYRIEGETSWTTIFTMSTVGLITHSAVNREGVTPKVNLRENKQIEFQLFSTGGAEITGYQFTQEVVGKRKY